MKYKGKWLCKAGLTRIYSKLSVHEEEINIHMKTCSTAGEALPRLKLGELDKNKLEGT